MTQLKRSSGLLLHPTSLPGPFGIGEISIEAYKWIDFLVEARQSVWQILPLGPTGYGNSPYQTTSVFAGNPLLIDPARLVSEGYLSQSDLDHAPAFSGQEVEFDKVIDWKIPLLLSAYERFEHNAPAHEREAFASFCHTNDARWLDEYAFFVALKNFYDKKAWYDWPPEVKLRRPEALQALRQQLARQIAAQKFLQYQFYKQWQDLKRYANERGVQIMGDIPIYITLDSAEVWANQEAFCLDEDGNPTIVAGVPPDYFSKTGQLWGNPIYDWEVMHRDGYRWWAERVRVTLESVDLVRIDHFRGFEAYWAVPYGHKTAEHGEWLKGPGRALFDALRQQLGEMPIVVEDLGFITPEVGALRDHYNFPGMKILQFSFGGDPEEPFLPHNYQSNCIVYTGSHDNDTTKGWFKTAPKHEQEYCLKYLGRSRPRLDIAWELMRLGSASVAKMCIFPLQDMLSLDSRARMNVPGKASGNWGWRVSREQIAAADVKKLAEMTEMYGRAPGK